MSAAETKLQDFVEWAKSIGIELNGAAPKTIPGAGTGLATTRHVKQGEVIVHVPRDCMMNPLSSVPGLFDGGAAQDGKASAAEKEELSPQAQLAVALNAARKKASQDEQIDGNRVGDWYKQCSRHWPGKDEFERCLLWLPPRLAADTDSNLSSTGGGALEKHDTDTVAGLRDLLPSSIRNPLERLEKDLAKDKAAFKSLLDSRPENDSNEYEDEMAAFEYHWTLTNTRSFFWKPAGTKKGCMVMCPVLDFVNHTSHASNLACEVASTAEGYTLRANRDYSQYSGGYLQQDEADRTQRQEKRSTLATVPTLTTSYLYIVSPP